MRPAESERGVNLRDQTAWEKAGDGATSWKAHRTPGNPAGPQTCGAPIATVKATGLRTRGRTQRKDQPMNVASLHQNPALAAQSLRQNSLTPSKRNADPQQPVQATAILTAKKDAFDATKPLGLQKTGYDNPALTRKSYAGSR